MVRESCLGYYDNKLCELNLISKKYQVLTYQNQSAMNLGNVGAIMINLQQSITAADYHDGCYTIYAEYSSDGDDSRYVEVIIKDGYFTDVSIVSYYFDEGDNQMNNIQSISFKYKDVDTSKVVMSLNGYTEQ